MDFIKRSFIYIIRNRIKSLMILLVVFLLGSLVIGSLAIMQSVDQTVNGLFKSLPVVASIGLDYQAIDEKYPPDSVSGNVPGNSDVELVTAEQLEQIGQLPYVKAYDYSLNFIGLRSETYLRPSEAGFDNIQEFTNFPLQNGIDTEMYDMKMGYIRLVEGRTFTEAEINAPQNVALISKACAEVNNLGVGSVMDLYAPVDGTEGRTPFSLEIVGIFEPSIEIPERSTDSQRNAYQNAIDNFGDAIYLPYKVAALVHEAMYGSEKQRFPELGSEYHTSYFVLNDLTELSAFKEAAEKILLDSGRKYYAIYSTGDKWETVVAPMRSMQWIASLVFYAAIAASVIILALMILFFSGGRKTEIGLYMSLGERKKRIAAQILIEIFLVTFAGLTLSLAISNLWIDNISQSLLTNQLIAQNEQTQEETESTLEVTPFDVYYPHEMLAVSEEDAEAAMSQYAVVIDNPIILIYYLAGLSATILSTILPIIYILRLNPKKVLM